MNLYTVNIRIPNKIQSIKDDGSIDDLKCYHYLVLALKKDIYRLVSSMPEIKNFKIKPDQLEISLFDVPAVFTDVGGNQVWFDIENNTDE